MWRFLAVVYPVRSLSTRTVPNVQCLILFTWIVILLANIPLWMTHNVMVSTDNGNKFLHKFNSLQIFLDNFRDTYLHFWYWQLWLWGFPHWIFHHQLCFANSCHHRYVSHLAGVSLEDCVNKNIQVGNKLIWFTPSSKTIEN